MLLPLLAFLSCLHVSTPLDNNQLLQSAYSVIIDASAKESTVSAYEFMSSWPDPLSVRTLLQESVTPGIRAFGDHPSGCIHGLHKLVTQAKNKIARREWSRTPLQLIAATNLRNLPGNQSVYLLNVIQSYFKSTELRVDSNSVSLMEGRRKFFTWLCVNALLGNFKTTNSTAAVLSLEGGASEVTFAPDWGDLLARWQWEITINMTVYGKMFKVFGYSYFGLGFNEGRKQILEREKTNETVVYKSHCIHPAVKTKWMYRGKLYIIEGINTHHGYAYDKKQNKTEAVMEMSDCSKVVRAVVSTYLRGPDLKGKTIYATNHFYHLAVKLGLIKVGENIKISVFQIKALAKTMCKFPNFEEPFLCMDLVFVNVMLRKLYSLNDDSQINLVLMLNGSEVSWPLGAAFDVYQKDVNLVRKNK